MPFQNRGLPADSLHMEQPHRGEVGAADKIAQAAADKTAAAVKAEAADKIVAAWAGRRRLLPAAGSAAGKSNSDTPEHFQSFAFRTLGKTSA